MQRKRTFKNKEKKTVKGKKLKRKLFGWLGMGARLGEVQSWVKLVARE